MAPTLYCADLSPCARAVYLTAAAINLPLERKLIDLGKGEQLKPEFLKLNPQHTVPVLKDDDFVVWDGHAISAYLVGKYGKDDSLYPKDLRQRAIIDQRLHFESSVLFPRLAGIVRPILREGMKSVPKEKSNEVMEGYNFLETFLEGREYVAGANVTIADFHTVATITQLNILVPLAANRYPNIAGWMGRMEKLPYYSENQSGCDMATSTFKHFLSS